jgi:hypothetical protein
MRRLASLYPFLLVLVPVLFRARESPGYYTLADLALILAVLLALTGAVYALAAAVFRGRAEGRLPALAAFLAVLWFFGFDTAARALPRAPHHLQYLALALAGVAASVVLFRWLARRPAVLGRVATFLTLTGALLVLRSAVGIGVEARRAHEQVARSALTRELARPIAGPATAPEPRRDVYLIVLDEYANAGVLRDALDFDNGAFVDSLRALGFYVPAAVRSNYGHTLLSLPSLLNAAHVYPLARELPPGSTDPTLPNHLLAHGRIARFLQARGYRYVVFPALWWGATRTSPIADSVVHVWHGLDLDRALGRTELRRTLRLGTPLDYLHRDARWDGDFVRRTLDGVARLPSVKQPVFAFAHVLSPHFPYVLDAACRTPPRFPVRPARTAYVAQLQCLNRMVLDMVGRLIRQSDVPPVILLQGDHGSTMLGFATARTAEQVSAPEAWERFGAFGAYYLPDGGAAAFGDTVTVVNVLGHVLRTYVGARLPREPDTQYLSVERAPFRLVRVDPEWLAEGGRRAAVAERGRGGRMDGTVIPSGASVRMDSLSALPP